MDETSNTSPAPVTQSHFWKELIQLAIIALVVVIPFRLYIAQPFIVDGLSMYPTFDNAEYLIIDELTYHFKTPERGSVLIFKYPKDPSKYFIKRVIGLPGETVSIVNGDVTITTPGGETLAITEPYIELTKIDDTLTLTLGGDEFFVMGDNRAQSADSRIWGAVPRANIVGRPMIRFIPPALFPGEVSYTSAEPLRTP